MSISGIQGAYPLYATNQYCNATMPSRPAQVPMKGSLNDDNYQKSSNSKSKILLGLGIASVIGLSILALAKGNASKAVKNVEVLNLKKFSPNSIKEIFSEEVMQKLYVPKNVKNLKKYRPKAHVAVFRDRTILSELAENLKLNIGNANAAIVVKEKGKEANTIVKFIHTEKFNLPNAAKESSFWAKTKQGIFLLTQV